MALLRSRATVVRNADCRRDDVVIPRGRCVVALALVLAIAGAGRANAAPSFSDADYWALADRIMTALDPGWSPSRGEYADRGHKASVRVNAAMLLTHAVAAQRGPVSVSRDGWRAGSRRG